MRLLKAAALAVSAFAAPAHAAVIYTFSAGDTGFRYTAPSFISANLGLPASNLDSCTTVSGECSSVQFFPDVSVGGNPADQLIFTRSFPGAGTIGGYYTFAADAFDGFGTYAGTDGSSLTVSAGGVPEPASWALMIVGFGLVGFSVRRRYRLPFTATLSGRSSPNTR